MKTKRIDGKWWVTDVPDTVTECGPYDTKKEADEARRGLERFFNVEIHKRPRR